MKKKIIVIIIFIVLIIVLLYLFGIGGKRTDVYLQEYSVSSDGSTIKIKVGVSSSSGYIRNVRIKHSGTNQFLTFYSTFGINNKINSKNEFELDVNELCGEIYFYQGDEGDYFNEGHCGYKCVLEKDSNEKWILSSSKVEEKSNISTITNTTNNMTMPNTNVVASDNTALQNQELEEKDYSIDIDKVKIQVDNSTVTPISISIIITNNNENELTYGEEFKIQKMVDREWGDLEYLPNTIWNAMAYITKGKSQTTKKLNLEYTYGELSEGIYRVVKPVYDGNGNEVNIYSDEFEIK